MSLQTDSGTLEMFSIIIIIIKTQPWLLANNYQNMSTYRGSIQNLGQKCDVVGQTPLSIPETHDMQIPCKFLKNVLSEAVIAIKTTSPESSF